jgi:GntR family transcriptional regulator
MKPDDNEPIPLRVADELERMMAAHRTGAPLVSENELAFSYGVTRRTARAVVAKLERGLLGRNQGQRTPAEHRIEYCLGPDVAPSWTRTVVAAGHEPRSQTVALRLREAPRQFREALLLRKTADAVFLARERYVDDELAAYAETWLAADLVPNLAATLGNRGSLYRSFADVYGLEPVRSFSRAQFVVATIPVARKLKMDRRPLVLRLEGRTDSVRARRPVEVTTSWLRADLFRVVFALERERT